MKKFAFVAIVAFLLNNVFAQYGSSYTNKNDYYVVKFLDNKKVDFGENKWTFSNDTIDHVIRNLDSIEFIELLKRLEFDNPGYKIPNINEIIALSHFSITKPKEKIKKQCEKTFKCAKHSNLYYSKFSTFSESIDEFFYNHIHQFEGEFTHPHDCSNCKDWSDEYRRKVACHQCKDERITYCGKTVPCPRCKGKGYKLVDTQEKTIKYKNIVSENNIKEFDLIPYFNSPKDFGLYNPKQEYQKKWNQIFFESNVGYSLILSTRNLENEINDYKIEQEKKKIELENQDKETLEKINSFLKGNQLNEAAIEFSKLNFPQKELKNEIFEKLKDYTSNYIDSISDIEFQKFLFLTENKQKLKDLSKGKHTLKSDLSGNLSIDNYEKIIGKLNSNHSKFFGSFEVPVKAQCTFEIASSIEIIGEQKIQKGTTKSIYQKSNNKYFRSNKLSEKHKEIYAIYDPIIPKNKLRIMQPRIEYYKIRYFIISEKQAEPQLIEESKVHVDVSRIVSKSTKITAISALVFWGGLRIYEYFKIP